MTLLLGLASLALVVYSLICAANDEPYQALAAIVAAIIVGSF